MEISLSILLNLNRKQWKTFIIFLNQGEFTVLFVCLPFPVLGWNSFYHACTTFRELVFSLFSAKKRKADPRKIILIRERRFYPNSSCLSHWTMGVTQLVPEIRYFHNKVKYSKNLLRIHFHFSSSEKIVNYVDISLLAKMHYSVSIYVYKQYIGNQLPFLQFEIGGILHKQSIYQKMEISY